MRIMMEIDNTAIDNEIADQADRRANEYARRRTQKARDRAAFQRARIEGKSARHSAREHPRGTA